ncbi:peptide ABC transporter [Vibrio sp. 10N.286.49.C2]|uniref:ABC transporter ATP-binding protein n=1 Tax=unclassified Vibrio TaxID=2614977 RepID=UPI000C81CE68|nr:MULTISPECIES: ATP-binding cassette domain-containing protein [unclassified Vibrio]PMH42771.1 peptide ABC transporter [Vibrio sp. 10N.286.49.C2]PMH53891.1 peptide ABC transporter [Vibrio sp. 10N.286.49.B1]PMH79484.1 peptide ABC transporter [Vibrio sp. 10N.286.48.B7]
MRVLAQTNTIGNINNKFACVRFDNVSIHHYSIPSWLGGTPFQALNNISLVIDNQNLAIVGPSGAGKSTLIELLFGLKAPSKGRVEVSGISLPIRSQHDRIRVCRDIQMMPQEPHTSLNPYYTVSQILTEPLVNLNIVGDHRALAQQALDDVGLSTQILALKPNQLSTGQAQRVALARALIVEPSILVADEPTSSLDPVNRQRVLDLLNSLKKKRKLILILVTHDLQAAHALCDELLVLDHGNVVEHGDCNRIMNHPNHSVTRSLIAAQTALTTNRLHNI